MKRAILPALMIMLLCACGNTSETEAKFAKWRESIVSVEIKADVTVTQGETSAEYTLFCDYSPEKYSVEIFLPESLAGITATRSGDDTEIQYDGLILSLGEMDGITPINALPTLVDTVKAGHLELCYNEPSGGEDLIAAELTHGDTVTVHIWLAPDSMTPIRAEFESGDKAEIKAVITEWNIR